MTKIKRIFIRIYRLIVYRRRIYGKLGSHNKFASQVSMTSEAVIGNYNYFGERAMVGNAVIGNYCSIAPDVKIGQSQHSLKYITTYNNISKHNIGFKLTTIPAVIHNDVWIGANAVIMQGITIGNGAVIGANAVVTKDVPDYGIVVGVPAKFIKYRFSQEQINIINDSKWWNYDLDDARKIVKELEVYL